MLNHTIFKDYLTICKPRVVLLMLITAWVGMYLASVNVLPWNIYLYATIGIAFAAGGAAVINHVLDRGVDKKMQRTAFRPVANGRIQPYQAIIFAFALSTIAWVILYYLVNAVTAILTFATLIGYAFIYTSYLKRATPQNIVIGGLSGAMPPLLGWTAVSGHISPEGLLLVLIIFVWTPPHFWALAIYRVNDYATANIPMLPVTHGVPYTKLSLLLYTILLSAISLLPFAVKMAGGLYLTIALCLNAIFLYLAIKLYSATQDLQRRLAIRTFHFSQVYLLLLFLALLIEKSFGV